LDYVCIEAVSQIMRYLSFEVDHKFMYNKRAIIYWFM